MPQENPRTFKCDFGSQCRLKIGINFGHAVIAVEEPAGNKAGFASLAMTPDSLEALGARLFEIANECRSRANETKTPSVALLRDGGK